MQERKLNVSYTWKGCGTADASTCSREPPQSVSHGSSSGTWQTLLGNPGTGNIRVEVLGDLPAYTCPFIPDSPYRGSPQGLTFSSPRSFHTSVSLWQPVKNKQLSLTQNTQQTKQLNISCVMFTQHDLRTSLSGVSCNSYLQSLPW